MTLKIWIVFFSGMTSCSLARGYKFFRETYYLQLQSRRQGQLQSRQWKQQFIPRCWLSFTRLNYVITKPTVGKEIPPHFTEHTMLLLCSQAHYRSETGTRQFTHTLTKYFSKTQLNIILGLSINQPIDRSINRSINFFTFLISYYRHNLRMWKLFH
jgi:hypothetical protein